MLLFQSLALFPFLLLLHFLLLSRKAFQLAPCCLDTFNLQRVCRPVGTEASERERRRDNEKWERDDVRELGGI